jgi:hypothetical protein
MISADLRFLGSIAISGREYVADRFIIAHQWVVDWIESRGEGCRPSVQMRNSDEVMHFFRRAPIHPVGYECLV